MTHTLNELVMGTAPTVIDETRAFWEATMREELVIQRCVSCGSVQHPGGPCCSSCLSPSLEWVKASGRGSVFSFTVVRHAFHPAFMDKIPYVLADVRLAEGPVMTAGLTGCEPEQVHIDMSVSIYFAEPLEDAFHVPLRLPKFKPA